jgi:uncharacterized protein with PIN domain
MEGKTMDEIKDIQTTTEETTPVAQLTQFFGNAKDVLAKYTHCAICGSNLHFNHITDFAKNLTQEIARCPECGIKARQVMHKLQ